LEQRTDILSQLSLFKHWYYIKEIDMFGPNKYIGYKEINTSKYNRGYGLDGRDTERVLQQWFRQLAKGSGEEMELKRQLEILLGSYGKKLRSNCLHPR